MRYLRAGSGPALILLHGLMGYSFSWRFALPGLAPYATVYAPDMLGAGFSERPAGLDCSMRATAERLLEFIAALGISSFDLVGTSHGGAVAALAAAQCTSGASVWVPHVSPFLRDVGFPGGASRLRLRRLVLVAPVNPYSAHGQWLAPFFGSPAGSLLFRLTFARMKFLYPWILRRLYGDPRKITPGTLEGYAAPLAVPGRVLHGIDIVRTWTQDLAEVEAALPQLKDVPTLLIWGSDDVAVYASSAAALAKHLPHSKVIVFPGVGHLPYEECPEEFNRALIEFLSQNSAGH